MQHFVDPTLDILSPPYEQWHKGAIEAQQVWKLRNIEDPNKLLFPREMMASSETAAASEKPQPETSS